MNALWLQGRYAEALGWTLVHSLWELAVIAALTAMALAVLRRSAAPVRYAVACAGLVLMVGLMVGTYGFVLRPETRAVPVSQTTPTFTPETVNISLPPAMALPATDAPRSWRALMAPILPWMVVAYLIGAGFFALRMAGGWWQLRRLATTGTPLLGLPQDVLDGLARQMGVTRAVRLVQAAALEVPCVIGMLRPVILLPATALTGLTTDQLSALLAHELAHIRRHDYLVNILQSMAEALLFYHPAVWWLSATIRQERELCCDDAAVALAGGPARYARALAAMEALRGPRLALGASGGRLLPRIERLLGVPQRRGIPAHLTLTATAILLALAAALYVGCSRPSTPAPVPTTSTAPAATQTTHVIQHVAINAHADGTLKVDVALQQPLDQTLGNHWLVAQVHDGESNVGEAFRTPVTETDEIVHLTTRIDSPTLWTPEKPNEYELEIQLLNGEGRINTSYNRVLDTYRQKFSFGVIDPDEKEHTILIKAVFVEVDKAVFKDFLATPEDKTNLVALIEPEMQSRLGKLLPTPDQKVLRPYLLIHDGQDGTIEIGNQVPSIKGYRDDPTTGRTPDVVYINAGLTMSVRGTVVDLTYPLVKLEINASYTELLSSDTPPTPALAADGKPKEQTPQFDTRQLKATVAIKNGDTIMLAKDSVKAGKVYLLFVTPHATVTTTTNSRGE